jgi:tRNA modification GTPase
VSAVTGEGLVILSGDLVEIARASLAPGGEVALNRRQRALLEQAAQSLRAAGDETNPLIKAENLRLARLAFDQLTGRSATEDVLDTLFRRFCIGK